MRSKSPLDSFVSKLDTALKTVAGGKACSQRPSPADKISEFQLTGSQKDKIARLMRINHCGEVCAQALYEGQALTSNSDGVINTLRQSALEEEDHLYWCEQRVKQLEGRLSLLNPIFYALSYGVGATTGAMGNRINLGFLAATEEEVCHHLRDHLQTLPDEDAKSRSVLEQMLEDEAKHASTALSAGGAVFPSQVKKLMRSISAVMTKAVYWI